MSHREHFEDGSVLHVEPAPGLPLVSFNVSFRTGGTWDPPGKDGLLRMMLRLMRRGTRALDANEIDERIDRLGAEVSVEVAPTSATLHAQVVARNLDPFVELIAELLAEPAFAPDELERLRRESEAELHEARDNDRGLVNLWFRRAVFAGHPYERSAYGRLSSLPAIDEAAIRDAHRAVVRRGNAVVGVSGAIDVEQARALHRQLLARLPMGEPPPVDLPEPSDPPGRRLIFVDKPERTQTQVLIGRLGTHAHDADHTALSLANTAFGGTFTARLMQEVRAKRGWSYGAYARLSIDRRRHAFSMWTFPAAEQVAECIQLQMRLWRDFHAKGISQRELRFFRNYLTRSYAFEIDTAQKRLGQAMDLDLLELPPDYYSHYLERLAAVTVEQANQAVAQRLDPASCRVVVVGTAESTLDGVRGALDGLDRADVVSFEED